MTRIKKEQFFEPRCLATTIGSLPHTDVESGTDLMFDSTPEIPGWVQFPKRMFYENMMVQFTEGIPGLVDEGDRIYLDIEKESFIDEMTEFYELYLDIFENNNNDSLDRFAISEKYGAGFNHFMEKVPDNLEDINYLKGQVTGPFTLGMNLKDKHGKCSYYDDQLRDIIVKATVLKAMWQINQFSDFNKQSIILLDEPFLLSYGTQVAITVTKEDIINDINAVADAIHKMGGIAGVHCEENTDWSLLMETNLDLLVFDAYDHMQAITLYSEYLKKFFDRGGSLGWGIVPTLDIDAAATETLPSLMTRFNDGIKMLEEKGFERDLLLQRALITPSCGAGGVLTEALAERVLGLLKQVSLELRIKNNI